MHRWRMTVDSFTAEPYSQNSAPNKYTVCNQCNEPGRTFKRYPLSAHPCEDGASFLLGSNRTH